MQEKRRDNRKRSGQVSGVQVMFATILSVGLILAINFSSRISEGQPIQEAYNRVLTEIEGLKAEHARLTALRDYVLGDPYVEQWARSDGKMVLPGEVLMVPVPSSASMTQEPEPLVNFSDPAAPPSQPPTWTLWWQIFFDSPPPSASTGN